jgi:hypothetical protein
MPYRSLQQERFFHSPGAKRAGISNAQVKEWDTATKGMKLPKRVKKKKIVVDNHIRAFGEEEGGKIKINVRRHKGDKEELADTVYHESYHARHPKATEKATYKKTAKAMKEMSYSEKVKLADSIHRKSIHYRQGSLKRKLKLGRGKVVPGTFYKKYNELKFQNKQNRRNKISPRKLGIMGLT